MCNNNSWGQQRGHDSFLRPILTLFVDYGPSTDGLLTFPNLYSTTHTHTHMHVHVCVYILYFFV